jgi:hypothetical protein
MLIVVLRGNNLEIKLRLVFFLKLNLHSNQLQMTKCYPHAKEGGHYTYCNQLTILETIVLVIFWVALQFEVGVPQLRTSHMDFTPTNICPTKNPQ